MRLTGAPVGRRMKAKVGIYKFHLGADGGGDERALALAEHLSTKHNVWLLTSGRPDLHALESYFDVDLSRVRPAVFDRGREGPGLGGATRRSSTRRATAWARARRRRRSFCT